MKRRLVTSIEYLALERESTTKHELVNGRILAMAGASPLHNLLAANAASALGRMLTGKPGIVLSSNQRVHAPPLCEGGLYAYPDVTVVCARPEFHPEDMQTLVNPKVIVEVLSDSTEAYDRGAKFSHYQGSLRSRSTSSSPPATSASSTTAGKAKGAGSSRCTPRPARRSSSPPSAARRRWPRFTTRATPSRWVDAWRPSRGGPAHGFPHDLP